MDEWTRQDEQTFAEMATRRSAVVCKREEVLMRVVRTVFGEEIFGEIPLDHITMHAAALREALRPYDMSIPDVNAAD